MKNKNNSTDEIIIGGETFIKHVGLASDKYDQNGSRLTSILILGDPLHLIGYEPKRIEILIPESAIGNEHTSGDATIAIKQWAAADGSHTQLICLQENGTNVPCSGPVCSRYAGLKYVDCPFAFKKGEKS